MRTKLSLLLLIIACVAHAQNWALLNPAYKYNYSNDGSDTISNQIFVTHIDTLGVDSFRYELNRIGVVCDDCTFLPEECTPTFDQWAVLGKRGQFLNTQAIICNEGLWILEPAGMVVRPNAEEGEEWEAGGGLVATVTSSVAGELFGESDSLKTITLSNGLEIVTSKNHGLCAVPVDLSPGSQSLTIIGIEGLEAGFQFPTLAEIFDYQPGDVLQYQTWSEGLTGEPFVFNTCHGTQKLIILQRDDQSGQPLYTVRWVIYSHCTGDSFNGPYTVSVVDTSLFDPRVCQSSLVTLALENLWPGAIGCGGIDCAEPFDWNAAIESFPNEDGRYVIQSLMYEDERILRPCTTDSSAYSLDYGGPFTDRFRYEQGIGLLNYYMFFFEYGESRDLEAWSINGVTQGSIASDQSILLGLGATLQRDAWSISPNPASDELGLLNLEGGRHDYHVSDLTGRILQLGSISPNDNRVIRLSSLPEGIYILTIANARGSRTKRFVVKR